jgi:hypothetical protein
MIGKLLLPRLGGTPAVWNTCMLFFQVCLLGGYAYAHAVATRVPLRGQAFLHLALLIAALFTLPIAFRHVGDPPVDRNPIPWLLSALFVTAGPAFFVVSSNAPLLQRWFAATGRDPYFLYAASNVGSLVALLAYPLFIEPRLRLAQQSRLWTFGYVALIALIAACALRTRSSTPGQSASAGPDDPPPPARAPAPPSRRQRVRWLILAFVPSSYLLGVTTFISADIAAVPLLWVVPLALYLLTFILVFATRPPLPHRLILKLLPPAILAAVMLIMARASQPVWLVLAVHLLAFFVAAMACHGELARLRPPPARLTDFYLMLSFGGALGGAFNAILAPAIFDRPLEYPIALALACLVALPRHERSDAGNPRARRLDEALDYVLPLIVGVFAVLAIRLVPARTVREALPLVLIYLSIPALLCWTFAARPMRFALGVVLLLVPAVLLPPGHVKPLAVRRSFFGVHRILLTRNGQFIHIFHGTTMHGAQQADPATRKPIAPDCPTSYYYEGSPYAQVLATAAARNPTPRVGVAGLGGGSLAGFANAGWEMRFFEIDPVVVWAAEQSGHFTFVPAARARSAKIEIILGDARLMIAREPERSFDLLALDAFNGDSIPVHLLTREAVAMYLAKLREDGLLVMHISNLYLDLEPAVAAVAAVAADAADAKCVALVRDDNEPTPQQRDRGATGSRVVVIARSAGALAPFAQDPRWRRLQPPPNARPWTDDFSNLAEIVRWTRPPD